MSGQAVLAFWGASLLLIMAPGLDWGFTLSSALQGGSILAAPAGLTVGYSVMTLVVAAGLGAVLARSTVALTVLTVAGGLYLMWLGAGALTSRRPAAAGGRQLRSNRDVVLQGIGVSGLNPKALLIFVALLPQFASAARPWPLTVQLVVLGMVFTATCALFYAGLGAIARRAFLSRPAATRLLSVVSGVSMLIIGAVLVGERLLA